MGNPRETPAASSGRAATKPPEIARVKIGRFRSPIAVDDRRERAALGMSQPEGHVTVLLGIMRRIGCRKQGIKGGRRLDRIEAVALVDSSALGDQPTPAMALDTVEKTGKGCQIGFDGPQLLAHPDD